MFPAALMEADEPFIAGSGHMLFRRVTRARAARSVQTFFLAVLVALVLGSAAEAQTIIGVYADADGQDSERDLDAFNAALGEKVGIDNNYEPFAWRKGTLEMSAYAIQLGIAPMISWSAGDGHGGCILYSVITGGAYDSVLKREAARVAAMGVPVYLRLFYEPTNLYEDAGCQGKNPKKFIAAYRYVVRFFRAAGATNAKWVWALCHAAYADGSWPAWYPGREYVDEAGEDVYDTVSGSLDPPVFPGNGLCSSGIDKPQMISEAGAIGARDQRVWLNSVKVACPNLSAFLYWDARGARGDFVIKDLRVFRALAAIGDAVD